MVMRPEEDAVTVIGAGVVGAAVAYALAREGRPVLLVDRDDPGVAGASFGNAGHIASELVEPLPSPALLFGFWREHFALDGPLDLPLRRITAFVPWALQFASAAFRQKENTGHLAPLVRPAVGVLEEWLREIGRPELMRRHGHYEIWLGGNASAKAHAQVQAMERLEVPTSPAPEDLVTKAMIAASAATAAGLWFPGSAHVLDPLEVVRAFVAAAVAHGAQFRRADVRALEPAGEAVRVIAGEDSWTAHTAVVTAGVWSAPLLAPFGLRAPLEAACGYHVEMRGDSTLADAPVLYSNERVVVTPMAGRLRATSFMEFSGADAVPDPRKPAQLRSKLRRLGFHPADDGASWKGPRPVLPDYLPGIGRAPGPSKLFYSIGHQHIGLTIAPVTAELVADLVAGREPRLGVDAFSLGRFR